MAITTLDGIIAGMQPAEEILKIGGTMEAAGIMHSHFYSAGRPGPAVAPSPGVAGEALTTYAGQIPFSNPVSGNSYLARFTINASLIGGYMLVDRLWHNSGLVMTTTTEQAVNSVAFPARDRVGSANGAGVMVGIEVSTASGNSGAVTTISMRYLNQDGVEKVATIPSFPATAAIGTFVPFTLAAGDTGVRQVLAITLGTSLVSGGIHLVAYRVLTSVDVPVIYAGTSVDALQSGFVRLYDNTVPFIIQVASTTTATTVRGQLIVTQG